MNSSGKSGKYHMSIPGQTISFYCSLFAIWDLYTITTFIIFPFDLGLGPTHSITTRHEQGHACTTLRKAVAEKNTIWANY